MHYFLAALIQLVWGLTPSASRLILDYLPVEIYSAIRYTFAGMLFLVVARIRHSRWTASREILPKLIGLGIVAYALDSLCTLYGLKIGGVLSFSLASSLNAMITAVVSIYFLKEKVGSRFYAALALSVGGGVFLFWGKAGVSSAQVAGVSLLLIWMAYVFEAMGFVFSRKLRGQVPLEEYLGILQLSGGLFMWGVCLALGRSPVGVTEMPPMAWAALAFVCCIACGVCYFLLYWLLNFVEGHRLAFFDCFHTLSAAVFSVLFFDDPYNWRMVAGGCLLLTSVWTVLSLKSEKERAPAVVAAAPSDRLGEESRPLVAQSGL